MNRNLKRNPLRDIYDMPEFKYPYRYPLAPFPYILDLEITNNCNMDCIMCGRQIMKRKVGYMSYELFKKVIDEAADEGCRGIRFIRYGEPFLHRYVFKMIRYVKNKGMLIHATTNGLFLKDKLKQIAGSNLDSIIFSFQGTTKEEYIKMRNNSSYDLIVQNIKELVSIRGKYDYPYIQVNTTLLDENEEQIKNFEEQWSKTADRVDWWYTSLAGLENVERVKPLLPRQRIDIGSGLCTEVRTKMSVNWDGKISACCLDFDEELIVGDLKYQTLKQIWLSKPMNHIRKILARGEHEKIAFCRKCRSKFLEK